MNNIKSIIALVISKQTPNYLTGAKTVAYQAFYFPIQDIYLYQKDKGYILNGVEHTSFESVMEEAKMYGIDDNTSFLKFFYCPEYDNGTFLVVENPNKEDEKLLFCGGFTRNGKLVFEDALLPFWEHTKLIKKLLRAYHRKGDFVAQ